MKGAFIFVAILAAVQAGTIPSEKSKRGVFGESVGLNLDEHEDWGQFPSYHQPAAHSYSVIHQQFIQETPVVHHQHPVIIKKYVPLPVVQKVIVPVTKTVVVPVQESHHGWSNSYGSGW